MTAERCKLIEQRLQQSFSPSHLLVRDQSHLHAGHAGARDGKGHFAIEIVSNRFHDQSRLDRHRMVFKSLEDIMSSDIHALKIKAQTPTEANSL
jgi:BolA protein